MKVLNAGIATYGTAREVALLSRIDRSNLKYVTVQHNANDFTENLAFRRTGRPQAIRRAYFDQLAAEHRETHRFLPSKYTYIAYRVLVAGPLAMALRGLGWPTPDSREFDLNGQEKKADYPKSQVDAFLYVLENSPIPLTGVHLIVTQIGGHPEFWGSSKPRWRKCRIASRQIA